MRATGSWNGTRSRWVARIDVEPIEEAFCRRVYPSAKKLCYIRLAAKAFRLHLPTPVRRSARWASGRTLSKSTTDVYSPL